MYEDETHAQLQARAEFMGFQAEPRDMDVCPHYVLWRNGEVHAKGSAEAIRLSLRHSVNQRSKYEPRDWEPPGYEHI